MGVLTRLANLIEENMLSLMDGNEDPERQLSKAMSELRRAHSTTRGALIQARTAQRLAIRRSRAAEREAIRCDELAVSAINRHQESEARQWLQRKLTALDRARIEKMSLEEHAVHISNLEVAAQTLSLRITELPAKNALLVTRKSLAQAQASSLPGSSQAFTCASDALTKIEDQVIKAEVEAEVLATESAWREQRTSSLCHRTELAFLELKNRALPKLDSGQIEREGED